MNGSKVGNNNHKNTRIKNRKDKIVLRITGGSLTSRIGGKFDKEHQGNISQKEKSCLIRLEMCIFFFAWGMWKHFLGEEPALKVTSCFIVQGLLMRKRDFKLANVY